MTLRIVAGQSFNRDHHHHQQQQQQPVVEAADDLQPELSAEEQHVLVNRTRLQFWRSEAQRCQLGQYGRVDNVVDVVCDGKQTVQFACSVYRSTHSSRVYVVSRNERRGDTTYSCVLKSRNLLEEDSTSPVFQTNEVKPTFSP